MSIKINSERKEKHRIVIVSIVTAICLLGDSMLYVVLPIYWHQAGLLSLWEVGIILSINRYVRIPLNFIIGWLYTKISLRAGFISAVILAMLSTIGYGVFEGLWLWILLRCIWGLAWSILRLGGFFSVLTYAKEENSGYLMGTYNGIHRLGSLAGMLTGGVLASVIGLKWTAIMFGAAAVVGLILVIIYMDNTKVIQQKPMKPTTPLASIMKNSFIIQLMVSAFLISLLFQGVVMSSLSYIVADHYNDYVYVFGLSIAAAALSGYIQACRYAWEPIMAGKIGKWSDGAAGRIPILVLALTAAAFGFLFVPWTLPIYMWLVIIVIVLMAATALTTVMDSIASDAAKSRRDMSLMTKYSVVVDLGSASGPLLAFLLLPLGYGVYYIFFGGVIILVSLSSIWMYSLKTKTFTA